MTDAPATPDASGDDRPAAVPDLRPIDGRSAFQQAVREAFARAADARSAEITLVDADFANWPLGERAVVESLGRWASSRARLTLLGGSFEALARQAPRFLEWRRAWSHIVAFRTPEDLDPQQLPTWLVVPGLVVVRLADPVRQRGIVSERPVDQVEAREAIDALSQRSVETSPATTLGL